MLPGGDGLERAWSLERLPGDPAADPATYGAAWGAMSDALAAFLDDLATARPTVGALAELTASFRRATHDLAGCQVDEPDRVCGRRFDLAGRGQTVLPPIEVVEADEDSLVARVVFGPRFLGGRGAAHGGAVQAVFDEVLGRLAQWHGPTARTAYLRVDFRAIARIGTRLELRAWFAQESGRKRLVRGTLHDRDQLCAEAEGLFIELLPHQP